MLNMLNVSSSTTRSIQSRLLIWLLLFPSIFVMLLEKNTHLQGETKHQVFQFLVDFESIGRTEQRYGILGEEPDSDVSGKNTALLRFNPWKMFLKIAKIITVSSQLEKQLPSNVCRGLCLLSYLSFKVSDNLCCV